MSNPERWATATSSMFFGRRDGAGEAILAKDLIAAKAAGIEGIELVIPAQSLSDRPTETWADLQLSVERIKAARLRLFSVHLPFSADWDISSRCEVERRRVVQALAKCIQWASRSGVPTGVIHSSHGPIPDADRIERLEQAKRSLAELAGVADSYQFNLAVECLPPTYLGRTSEELAQLVTGQPGLSICMDVNHLFLESHRDFLAQVGSHVTTVHLSDYDGFDDCHWLPGEGILNWEELVTLLDAAGYNGPFTFEVRHRPDLEPQDLVRCRNRLLVEGSTVESLKEIEA